MRKPKIECFRYKRYNDIYVSNVFFSTDALLSMLDVFQNKDIIILIESDENSVQKLLLCGKNIGVEGIVTSSPAPRFSAVCNKMDMHYLLEAVNVNDIEGAFIADINNSAASSELVYSIADMARFMVKRGMSDISLSINFPENQMVISLDKKKYDVKFIKDKAYSIFGK